MNMNTPNTNKWNFAKVKTIALMSLLTLATMFYSCGEDPIITPPDPPKPPEPPKPVVVDTIPTQIKSVADLDALFKSMPDVQPDTIRKFYDVLVANNLLMQSDGAGNFDPNTLNLMTKFGDLATGNRKDQRVKGMSFGGKAPGDGDDKFIFANDSIHITPAIWAQMKKPALGATQQQGGKGFYANAEDVGGFDPFASILRIIQSAPGQYTIPNSKAVEDNLSKIEDEINSGKMPIVDLVGDLGTNNNNAMTLERFVEILKDGKANQRGVLRFYAESDSVRHNLEFLENLASTNGVIVQKDGWIYVKNIGAQNLPTLEKILANGAKIRTGKITDQLARDAKGMVVQDTLMLTGNQTGVTDILANMPKRQKSGYFLDHNGYSLGTVTAAELARISTPATKMPGDLDGDPDIRSNTDIVFSKVITPELNERIMHMLAAIQNDDALWKQIRLYPVDIQGTGPGNIPIVYNQTDASSVKFDRGNMTNWDNANSWIEKVLLVSYQSFALSQIARYYNSNGIECTGALDMSKIGIVLPNGLTVIGPEMRLILRQAIEINAFSAAYGWPTYDFVAVRFINQSQVPSDKKVRDIPFTKVYTPAEFSR